jgi:hypothetical protein
MSKDEAHPTEAHLLRLSLGTGIGSLTFPVFDPSVFFTDSWKT